MDLKYTIILTILSFGAPLDHFHASTKFNNGNEYIGIKDTNGHGKEKKERDIIL